MTYYLVNFTATVNKAVSTNGIIRIAGLYNQHTAKDLISRYFYNKYYSDQIAVVINNKTEVSEEAYKAAVKKTISIN